MQVDGSAAPETSLRILLHVLDTPLPSQSDRLALMLMHVGVAHRIGARGRICFAAEPETGWIEGMVANSSRALREHLVLERRHHIRALAKRDHLVLQGLTRQVLLMQGVLGRTQCRLQRGGRRG